MEPFENDKISSVPIVSDSAFQTRDDSAAPPAGVLIYPMILEDSILYMMESEGAAATDIDLRDQLTGVHLTLRFPAQHAALALIGKQTK